MKFYERLRQLRKRAGMTQAQLAHACGWPGQSRVGNYERPVERGGREPAMRDLVALAGALGVSVPVLLGDSVQSQPTGIDTRILTQAARRICSRFAEDSMVFDVESEDDVALLVAVYMDEMAKEMPETTEATIVHFQRIRKIKGNAGDAHRTSVKAPKAS